jgi:hypothetical protein
VRHERGRTNREHLRDRDDDERQVGAQADRRDGIGPQPSHPKQIDQHIQRLKDHADEHEARRLEEMAGQGTGGEVLHTTPV